MDKDQNEGPAALPLEIREEYRRKENESEEEAMKRLKNYVVIAERQNDWMSKTVIQIIRKGKDVWTEAEWQELEAAKIGSDCAIIKFSMMITAIIFK